MSTEPNDAGNLIVSRRCGQGLFIGRGVRITIIEVDERGAVRMSIEAPQHIAISRDDIPLETHLKWQRERERSGAPRRKAG